MDEAHYSYFTQPTEDMLNPTISSEILTPSTTKVTQSIHVFNGFDYFLFCGMLVVSAIIGMYFAFFAKQKQNTTSEYLMGGKSMGLFPVSMSLIASWVSGITLLGMPAEIYTYGTQYWMGILGQIISVLVTGFFYLPVIYELQITTSYEYLAIRFNQKVRILGSLLFILNHLLYIPIVIYLPGLALSQVTGVNLHLVTPLVSLVCIFYTSLGGLKAVVWTDALQMVMMFGAMIVVAIVGTISVGGLSVVLERSHQSGRIEFFNMDIDPTVRHTFWNVSLGFSFMWITSLAANQGMVQRFLAMSSVVKCYKMLFMFWIGVSVILSLSCYSGLLIYATYNDCDLISSKRVNAPDQVLPYFVMDVTGFIPGLPGLFMAGVFSAALSTMSTGLNAMSGVIFEDYILPFLKNKPSEERASCTMKILCVILGIFCVGMVFVVENLGAVIQMSASFAGITSGPLLALFTIGMFFRWTNAKGALIGGISGLVVMGWIVLASQYAITSGRIKMPVKPMTTSGCEPYLLSNDTITLAAESSFQLLTSTEAIPDEELEKPWFMYRLSYTWYSFMGFALTLIVGLGVSWFTGGTDPKSVSLNLLTPLVRRYYEKAPKDKNVSKVNSATVLLRKTTEEFIRDTSEEDMGIQLKSRNGHFIHNEEMIKLASVESR